MIGLNPQPWSLEGELLAIAERARLAEILRDNAIAAASRRRCPGCGCSPIYPCVLELPDGAGTGQCAAAGDVPGHATCSACLTPNLRAAVRAA